MSTCPFSHSDPFRKARQETGILPCESEGENVFMILRHEEVRQAAKNWQTFSSDAPMRVPIHNNKAAMTRALRRNGKGFTIRAMDERVDCLQSCKQLPFKLGC
ncbi:hypothetical protein HQ447_13500 [bacterium]|nr:hypothetical protein [bacterium]